MSRRTAGVIDIPPGQGVAVGDELTRWADEQAHATTTYRVLDLNARKTIASGLSWGQAHQLIEQGRAADPAARFDIRTEIAS